MGDLPIVSVIAAHGVWLRDNEQEYYEQYVKEDKDIFDLWLEKGYVVKP